MKGRKPKPHQLKVLDGNRGHNTKQERREPPAFGGKMGKPPRYMQKLARKVHKQFVRELEAKHLAAEVYGPALEGFVNNYCLARECEAIIQAQGPTDKNRHGEVVKRPEVAIAKDCWAAVRQFSAEFGFTPVSHERVKVPGAQKTLEEILA